MYKRIIFFIPVLLFLALGLFFSTVKSPSTELESMVLNKKLPAFALPTLNDSATILTDKHLEGKKYLINFWGTYCPPCHAEHPFLLELASSQNITIVGVSYHDDLALARDFLAQKGNPFAFNVVDTEGRFGINMGVVGPPETFLIDEDEIVRVKHIGMLDKKVWAEKFQPHF